MSTRPQFLQDNIQPNHLFNTNLPFTEDVERELHLLESKLEIMRKEHRPSCLQLSEGLTKQLPRDSYQIRNIDHNRQSSNLQVYKQQQSKVKSSVPGKQPSRPKPRFETIIAMHRQRQKVQSRLEGIHSTIDQKLSIECGRFRPMDQFFQTQNFQPAKNANLNSDNKRLFNGFTCETALSMPMQIQCMSSGQHDLQGVSVSGGRFPQVVQKMQEKIELPLEK